ncbi:MAG: hypothetical protein VKS61_17865 [Candidatus Sericytochromatia bacterium]|nr:hypothetical protein [Candidatus Sericytochromatia bacterium]
MEVRRSRWDGVAAWVCAGASVLALAMGPSGGGVGVPAAGATLSPQATPQPNSPWPDRVWFNRRSGIFHTPKCMYYTQTKDGLFLATEEATRIGSACGHCLRPPRRGAEDRDRRARGGVRAWVIP